MEKVAFLNKEKETLSGVLQGSGAKGVILCHGFTGNKDEPLMNALADDLERAGFLVLRFDFSGSGESEGRFEEAHYDKEANDLLSAIEFLRKKGCDKLGLVGHSMGGGVAILTSSKENVDAVASLASPAFPNAERMAHFAWEWVKKELPPEFLECVMRTNIIDAAKKGKAPLLVIHGNSDSTINVGEGKDIYSHAKGPKKLFIVEGSGHALLHKRKEVVEEVVSWMRKFL